MLFNITVASIMLICAVLSAYQAAHTWVDRNRALKIKALTSTVGLASAIWSAGFGLLYLMPTREAAQICRGIGLIGVIVYLIGIEILIGSFSTVRKDIRNAIYWFSATIFILYPFLCSSNGAIYTMTEHGISYTIPNNLPNTLYSVYCVIMALLILGFILNIISTSNTKRTKQLGVWMMGVEVIIVLGMIADTILPPLTGIPAFPGSSITQFLGVIIIFTILYDHEKTSITVQNMSNFVYYSISVPVIIYDQYFNPVISNDAVFDFLCKDRYRTGNSELTLEALFGIQTKSISESQDSHQILDATCLSNDAACRVTIDSIADKYNDIIGYIVNIDDISQHILALEKVEEAKAMAEASNKSKSTFLANVSHEIRTPMNSIVGFTELLLNSDIPDEEKGYVDDIRNASTALLDIIDDVLDISRIESGNIELICDDFRLDTLLKEVYRITEPVITTKDIIFKAEIDNTIPNVLYGDSKRLKEILNNLIGNANKYTNYGSITLRVSHRKTENQTINLHIEIQDTGCGIKSEDIDTLFDTFSQVDGHVHQGVEGSGLELTITKSYVTLMDGRIYVESKYGSGSNFIVDIPLKVSDWAPMGNIEWNTDKKISTSLGNKSYENLKILVVDDSPINIKVFAHILKTYNISPDCVSSGAQSITMAKENEYDFIFMDQMMPEMDGIEAMKHIREISDYYTHGGKCRIVAFTANAVAGVEEQLLNEGFDSYMSKPIDLPELEQILSFN